MGTPAGAQRYRKRAQLRCNVIEGMCGPDYARCTMINWIDLLMTGIAVFALQLGFQKGFIKQASAFLSIFLGIAVAGRFYLKLAETRYMLELADRWSENASLILCYMGLFVTTLLFVQLFAHALHRSIHGGFLGNMDLFLGGIASVVKVYLLFAVVAWSVFQFIPDPTIKRHLAGSWLAQKAAGNFGTMLSHVPGEYVEKLDTFFTKQSPDQEGLSRRVCRLENLSIWTNE